MRHICWCSYAHSSPTAALAIRHFHVAATMLPHERRVGCRDFVCAPFAVRCYLPRCHAKGIYMTLILVVVVVVFTSLFCIKCNAAWRWQGCAGSAEMKFVQVKWMAAVLATAASITGMPRRVHQRKKGGGEWISWKYASWIGAKTLLPFE